MKVWDVNLPTFLACKVYDDTGAEVRAVFRVELDGDGDEGVATVRRYEMDANGMLVVKLAKLPVDAEGNGIAPDGSRVTPEPSVITERRWVRIVPTVFEQQADTPVEVRS